MIRPFLLAVALLCLCPFGAAAQDDDAGRTHFAAGAAYYDAGAYEDALREFRRAYDLTERPALFYNIHLCYQSLGELDNALSYLDRYLAGVEEIPNRPTLERRRINLQRRIDERDAAAAAAATTATATATETETETETETATETETETETATETETETETATESSGGGLHPMALVGFIGAGVGLVTMVTFGALALGEQGSVGDSACGMAAACDPNDVGTMDTFALISDIGLALTVVGAALGVTFLIIGNDDDGESATASISPLVGPGLAGASLSGSL